MVNVLHRVLKLAELLYEASDMVSLKKVCAYFGPFIKKYAHMVPDNSGDAPILWKKNLDYAEYENSPYFGSVKEFLERFPGGIGDWLIWREKNKKDRNKMYDISKRSHYVPEKGEDTKKFPKEPHLYSDEGLEKYKSIEEFLKAYRNNGKSADDAAMSAVKDIVNYWKLLLKKKESK